jgi:hypothetical protein
MQPVFAFGTVVVGAGVVAVGAGVVAVRAGVVAGGAAVVGVEAAGVVAGAAVVVGCDDAARRLRWRFARCERLWATGVAATVWVEAVVLVGAAGFEEDPQPATAAATRAIGRKSLGRMVIVVKDAPARRLLPLRACWWGRAGRVAGTTAPAAGRSRATSPPARRRSRCTRTPFGRDLRRRQLAEEWLKFAAINAD